MSNKDCPIDFPSPLPSDSHSHLLRLYLVRGLRRIAMDIWDLVEVSYPFREVLDDEDRAFLAVRSWLAERFSDAADRVWEVYEADKRV